MNNNKSDTLVGLGTGLVLFLCTIKAYTLGIKHNKQLSNGIIPKLNLNPISPITEAITHHKEDSKLKDELDDLMGATKEGMLNSIIKR